MDNGELRMPNARSNAPVAIFSSPFSILNLTAAACLAMAVPASAQIVLSANDGKAVLVDGVNTVPRPTPPDTLTIFDASVTPMRVIAELQVPNSVVGPPSNVAITPDGSLALIASAVKVDPADPSRTANDDRVTVVALQGTPRVLATVRAGLGASGVAINPTGTLALVANRIEGTVSVLSISGQTVTVESKVDLGAPDSGPSHVAFTPDGRVALVTRNNDSLITVLAVNGTAVANAKRDFAGGFKPYGMEITPDGSLALIASIGAGASGGTDVISVVDLQRSFPRTVDQIAVGITPEALSISPDGRHVAVTVMNGSNQPSTSHFASTNGRLRIFRIEKQTLVPVTETRIGRWCQGVAWTKDSRTVLAQCMTDREIALFRFDGKALIAAGVAKVNGGPAGIRAGK
jgi:DNA-binding beta-propeller fold protein YncE